MRTLLRLLVVVVLSVLRPRRRETEVRAAERPVDEETLSRDVGAPAWAERSVAVLFLGAAGAFVAFVVVLVTSADVQVLGLLLGGGLAAVAAALIVAGLKVVPQELSSERRTGRPHPEHQRGLSEDLRAGVEGVSRRRLLTTAAGTAGAALGAAAVSVPLTTIGPGPGGLNDSPWRAGVLLVEEDGTALHRDVLEVGSFVTAFPEGADKRELGSPLIVVRVDPETLELPPERRGWAPDGMLAFSKICTHAGCAVSLFRHPLDEELSTGPALQCPCHYSTFDVRRAAKVVFGPAGRPLPQLPLRVDAQQRLVAGGPLSGSVGPAWWGTERS